MRRMVWAVLWTALAVAASASETSRTEIARRLDALEAEVAAAEDVRAIKRLQRAYGYYLDKGMWEDLSEFFTDDAVANYPAGTYVGKASIREHLFRNVGNVPMGEVGLGDNRLYNHMNIQPVVHLDPDGRTAKGRWRAFAMFGSFGGGATWAEGVYEITYAKVDGVWKIRTLDYHSGFGASYQTGWVAPETPMNPGGAGGARRKLPHPPDKLRNSECDGFAAACIAPFHYENPGRSESGARVWSATPVPGRGTVRARAADLAHRASLLHDEQQIENLQRIYGYYLDRAMWDQIADLFAENGTLEIGLRGVYVGRKRIREFFDLLGPHGLKDGWLSDHLQLQVLASVAPDGKTARARSRELAMTGQYQGTAQWSEGIYENTFVKENGVWKIRSVRFYPTFITDYDKGWAKDAQPPPGVSTRLPPDRPPSQLYAIYPKAHIPPYHYRNPVTGKPPHYPSPARGSPDAKHAAATLEPAPRSRRAPPVRDVESAIASAERTIQRVKDYHELENLQSAYGYYVDKNLWTDLANLFSRDSSMELAQRGVYQGHDRVRAFLLNVFGRGGEGPVAGRLGNHIQMQPVITIAEDGQSAKIRLRMLQQLNFGTRASMGAAIYENEAVKEDGIWRISKLHAYNTFTAGYEGGWAKNPGRTLPGPSKDFPPDAPPTLKYEAFPTVYDIPFHYANPVTGRTEVPSQTHANMTESKPATPAGMPPAIAAALREIGARIEGAKTAELYAPLQPKEPYSNVVVTRDIPYGPHERHVLDVFRSPDKAAGKPVVVFIHGGGFARGSKRTPGSPFYDNVMLWAQSKGLIGVNINYRLAPQFQWPSGIEDLTRVVAWLKANIAQHGGDPNKIFLWGHSAGAAHAADYIAFETLAGRDPGLAGAILTSGFYELGPEVSIWKAYYGEDVTKYPERSSLPGLLQTSVPLLVNDAELDPENFRQDTQKLIQAFAKAGKPLRALHLPGHSHLSETYAVGSGDESLSGPVLEFILEVARDAENKQ